MNELTQQTKLNREATEKKCIQLKCIALDADYKHFHRQLVIEHSNDFMFY